MICYYCKQDIDSNAGEHMCAERREAITPQKKGKSYSGQSDTNHLQQQIQDYINDGRGVARRINVQGRYIEGNPVKVPTMGGKYRTLYTKGKWIKSGMLPGFEDISVIRPDGSYVAIEVKVGKDKMSPAQMKRREEVESNNGTYIIAKTFKQFKEEYER